MIEIVGEVRSRLLAAPAVAALVGTRVYPEVLPQDVTLPAIAVTNVTGAPINTVDGPGDLEHFIAQLDAHGATHAAAHNLAAACVAVLGAARSPAFGSLQVSRRYLYDDTTETHRVSIDVSVWAKGA